MKVTLEYLSGRINVMNYVSSSVPVTAERIKQMLESIYGGALLRRVKIEHDDAVRQIAFREQRAKTIDDFMCGLPMS